MVERFSVHGFGVRAHAFSVPGLWGSGFGGAFYGSQVRASVV